MCQTVRRDLFQGEVRLIIPPILRPPGSQSALHSTLRNDLRFLRSESVVVSPVETDLAVQSRGLMQHVKQRLRLVARFLGGRVLTEVESPPTAIARYRLDVFPATADELIRIAIRDACRGCFSIPLARFHALFMMVQK